MVDYIKKENYHKYFLSFIVLGMIVHFWLYSNGIQNPDGVSIGYIRKLYSGLLQFGRWGNYLFVPYRALLNSPIISSFMAITFMSLSCCLIIHMFQVKKAVAKICLGSVMMTCPAFAMTLSYYYCSDTYPFAFFLSCLCIYFTMKEGKSSVFFSILCVILSCSIYQAYVSCTAILFIFYAIILIIDDTKLETIFRKTLKILFSGISGCIIYLLISKVLLSILGLEFTSYSSANNIGLQNILMLKENLLYTYIEFKNFFIGNNPFLIKNAHWHRELLNIILFTITAFLFAKRYFKTWSKKTLLKVFLILFLCFSMPVVCGFIKLIAPEHNIETLISHAYYLIIAFVPVILERLIIQNSKFTNYTYRMSILILFVITWTYILTDNATYMYLKIQRDYTISCANRIMTRIEQLDGYQTNMPIAFVGCTDDGFQGHNELKDMSFGHISEWGNFWNGYDAINGGWYNIYKNYFGQIVKLASYEEYLQVCSSDVFQNMELYPANSSIGIIDNTVVVKFTDTPSIR